MLNAGNRSVSLIGAAKYPSGELGTATLTWYSNGPATRFKRGSETAVT